MKQENIMIRLIALSDQCKQAAEDAANLAAVEGVRPADRGLLVGMIADSLEANAAILNDMAANYAPSIFKTKGSQDD